MKPFLQELAEKMIAAHPKMDQLTFIFPNRRAALYFQNYLSSALTQPQWAPTMLSIEEYFKKNSDLLEPDRLTLIFKLYSVYGEVLKSDESFDRFYFWGEMLLRDFDEIDKYLVNARQLFTDLSKIKELDETFDYLTEEQKRFLQSFWMHFEEKPSRSKDEFLLMWKRLPDVYTRFTKALKKEHLGYEGMIHRDVAEKVQSNKTPVDASSIVFAGFNALTRAEEVLMVSLVKQGARVFWDADAYYVDSDLQEAGQFLRSYRSHPVLGATFGTDMPLLIRDKNKTVDVTGVPQRIGQAKLVGQEIQKVLESLPGKNLPLELSRTVVVLPDESMLLPLMHSLSDELQDINVTMGFPLRHTPLFSLIDLIVEMQLKRRGQSFSHREVNAILGHPYVLALEGENALNAQQEIVNKNRVFVQMKDLEGGHIFSLVFAAIEPENATDYLLDIIRFLGASFSDKRTFDREYAYHFHQHVSRLHAVLKGATKSPDWRGFQKLWRQVVLSLRVPFYGEPLRGLQIMGMLETRNLDFDHVFFLSANEGMLPASNRQGSYVPHAIRKAYGLPTFEQQDATYAYLFYRLLQRSERVSFYFNTEPDIIGNGELSRFVQQILIESKLNISRKVLHNEVHVRAANNFEIAKSPLVLSQLEKYIKEDPAAKWQQRLTPSSLNEYVECSLRFYLRHIAKLTEAEEVEEDVDARTFGNILHGVAHWFYEDLMSRGTNVVSEADLTDTDERVNKLIDRAFRELHHMEPDAPVVYEGQRVVVKAVAKTFIDKILEKDKDYAPFEIRMLEEPFSEHIELNDGRKVRIGGKIDRADWKDGTVRLIDYKTGKDDLNFESIAALFTHNQGRNKAAFQTILYAFVYQLHNSKDNDRLKPGLMNRKNLFGKDFEFGHKMGAGSRTPLEDVRPLLFEFGSSLHGLIEELFDPSVSFRQTTELKTCQWCAYKSFCRR